ncbi:MAG: substrate-binding domain-containing protein [Phycisphaerae bacterium]
MDESPAKHAENHRRNVVAVMDHQDEFNRGVLRGIIAYAHSKPDWLLRCVPVKTSAMEILQWRPAGVIGHFNVWNGANAVNRSGVPMVGVLSNKLLRHPEVDVDNHEVGIAAASDFIKRAFHHFAILGIKGHSWSQERLESFRSTVAAAGYRAHVYCVSAMMESRRVATGVIGLDENLRAWLENLPKPIALFAVNDAWAREAATLCQASNLPVPEAVAILGVDNDEFICAGMSPLLASIAIPWESIGRQAAAILDRIMRGENVPATPVLVPSSMVIPRQSLDVVAVADHYLNQALRFINEHACDPIKVGDVLRAVPVDRRWLERQCQRVLRRSPLEEIHRVQIIRAQQLLLTTNLRMWKIAAQVGIIEKNFAALFKQITGLTPTQWRRRVRPVEKR